MSIFLVETKVLVKVYHDRQLLYQVTKTKELVGAYYWIKYMCIKMINMYKISMDIAKCRYTEKV